MNWHWGARSTEVRGTLHPQLQRLADRVLMLSPTDCSLIEGHRDRATQNELYPRYTKLRWPESKHNAMPSLAMHLVPYPFTWPAHESTPGRKLRARYRLYMFVGFVLGVAIEEGIDVRSGADWDRDFDLQDQTFDDLVHVELMEERQ